MDRVHGRVRARAPREQPHVVHSRCGRSLLACSAFCLIASFPDLRSPTSPAAATGNMRARSLARRGKNLPLALAWLLTSSQQSYTLDAAQRWRHGRRPLELRSLLYAVPIIIIFIPIVLLLALVWPKHDLVPRFDLVVRRGAARYIYRYRVGRVAAGTSGGRTAGQLCAHHCISGWPGYTHHHVTFRARVALHAGTTS